MVRLLEGICVFLSIALLSADAATISGMIGDNATSGTPIAAAIVSLKSTAAGGGTLKDTTGEDGKFQFDNVATGNYTLSATAAKFTPNSLSDTIKVTSDDPIVRNLNLDAIVYCIVSGMVGDNATSGTPIAGAIVSLKSTAAGGDTRRDTTGADGKFQFDSVESGNYTLSASADKYVSATSSDTVKVVSSSEFVQNINLDAIAYCTVSGMVGDNATSGTPIAGAIVSLKSTAAGGGTRMDTTGADGKFQFDSVESGNYTLSASADKYVSATSSDTVKVVSSSEFVQNINLDAIVYCLVSGMVGDNATSGTPIAGAIVSLKSTATGGGTRMDTTGADGKYQFDSVSNGSYTLSASADKYADITVDGTVDVVSSAEIVKNIDMDQIVYISISGIVGDNASSGSPITGAVVTLQSTTPGASSHKDTTGADGKYQFDSVSNGKYTLSAVATQFFPDTSDTITVRMPQPIIKNFDLYAIMYTSISGTVTDSVTGKAVSGALVVFSRLDGVGAAKKDTTDSDGKYSIDSVTSGYLTVTVSQEYGLKVETLTIMSTSAQTVDIKVGKLVSEILPLAKNAIAGARSVGIGANGNLRLNNFLDAGIVRLYDMSGRQVYSRQFAAFISQQDLPLKGRIASGRYTVSITQKNSVFRSRILVP